MLCNGKTAQIICKHITLPSRFRGCSDVIKVVLVRDNVHSLIHCEDDASKKLDVFKYLETKFRTRGDR